MKRSFIREILEHTDSDTISFAGGLPDVGLFPRAALQRAAGRALAGAESLQYGLSAGFVLLREQIAGRYRERGFETRAENILITSGSQQGLDIITRYHSGADITIEEPSYLGALNVFTLNNMNTHAIPLTEEGIDADTFGRSLETSRLAYLIPDFQNPSGTRYTPDRRETVAAMLESHQTLLIEDAPYSELYFDEPIESISATLPTQSYHLGSFSKVLAPALRIGWIRADTQLLEPLIAYKEAMDLHTSGVTQRIVSAYLEEGDAFEAHLQTLRAACRDKMHAFADQLDRHLPEFVYTRPAGGMFIYGHLAGVDTSALVQRCLGEGVVFVPGVEFGGAWDAIRLNYTHSSLEEIVEGVRRIRGCLKSE